MDNELIEILKSVGVILSIIASLFTIFEIFKKHATARSIAIIVVLILCFFFLKYLIVLVSDDLYLLFLPVLFFTLVTVSNVVKYLVNEYENKYFRLSRQEYVKTIVFSSYNLALVGLLLVPIASMVINHIFAQPSELRTTKYIEDLRTKKINIELYKYLCENIIYSTYYLMKIVELILVVYYCSIGSRGIRGEYLTPSKLFLLIVGACAILSFISSNWYYEGLKIFFAQFG